MTKIRFRSEFEIQSVARPLALNHPIMLIGSCFSEHMFLRMQRSGFRVMSNPMGIVYHPSALLRGLMRIVNDKPYAPEEVTETPRGFVSFDHHGAFARPVREEFLAEANGAFSSARSFLREARLLVITFGSAYGYVPSGRVEAAANCHRLPGNSFSKILSAPEEIAQQTREAIETLRAFNPELEIELTVSPVRHLRDGVVENLRSKSVLLAAAQSVAEESENVHYFPSYELIAEDLKDYRWYRDDLMHPTDAAIQYVWERYSHARFEPESRDAGAKVESLARMFDHRPSDPVLHQSQCREAESAINELLKPWGNRWERF